MKQNIELIQEDNSTITTENKSRRSFIKKVAYVAPTLISLGYLKHPTPTKAEFGLPDGPSGGTGGGFGGG